MAAQKLILGLVVFIVVLSSMAEIIFEGFSWKPLLLMLATLAIVAFIWFFQNKRQ